MIVLIQLSRTQKKIEKIVWAKKNLPTSTGGDGEQPNTWPLFVKNPGPSRSQHKCIPSTWFFLPTHGSKSRTTCDHHRYVTVVIASSGANL